MLIIKYLFQIKYKHQFLGKNHLLLEHKHHYNIALARLPMVVYTIDIVLKMHNDKILLDI